MDVLADSRWFCRCTSFLEDAAAGDHVRAVQNCGSSAPHTAEALSTTVSLRLVAQKYIDDLDRLLSYGQIDRSSQ